MALIQQRDAIQTAKLVASIDQVSHGRFLIGIGGGWNQDEMEDHGTVYATRFKRVRESIEAMKEIWTKEKAEYHGEFVNFDPMIARPKPVQKPHPPIHVGGAFPHGARRAIRYGDGWIPTARGDIADVLPKFRDMAKEAGRDPASIEITSFGFGEDLDRVKRLAEIGVARVVPMWCGREYRSPRSISTPCRQSPLAHRGRLHKQRDRRERCSRRQWTFVSGRGGRGARRCRVRPSSSKGPPFRNAAAGTPGSGP